MYPFQKEINEVAKKFKLDPHLVAAIVYAESNFSTYAIRFESHYRWLFKVKRIAKLKNISYASEEALQRFSYGLMQVMGAVATERGYQGFLPELCTKPGLGLYYGCEYFSHILKRYGYDVGMTLAAYNAGSPIIDKNTGKYVNQRYVDKILLKYEEYVSDGNSTTENIRT